MARPTFATYNGDNPDTYGSMSGQFHWGPENRAGTGGGTLSYLFDPNANWTVGERASLVSGMELWSAIANISFRQTTTEAGANIGFTRNSTNDAFAQSNSVQHAVGTSVIRPPVDDSVVISLDMAETRTATGNYGSLGDFQEGGFGVMTVAHEVGHALGLGHGGPYNGNKTVSQQYGPYDNRESTLMSYFDPRDPLAYSSPIGSTNWTTGGTAYFPTTWMPVDIDAVQRLYGAQTNGQLNTAQTFGYNTTITGSLKPYFDFTVNTRPVVTLYGTATSGNTIDLSGSNQAATLNLNGGAYSSAFGMTNNIAIYDKTYIQNAVLGAGDDVLTVNVGRNNTADGGAGTNTARFSGNRADYTISQANGRTIVTRAVDTGSAAQPVGVESTLANFQALQFADQTVTVCYRSGTRIRAVRDDVVAEIAVEDLRVGDLAVTASGAHRPIRWLGHRNVDCTRHPRPEAVWPVRVRANAFGDGLPARDLWLSPDHAVQVTVLDAVLIPVKHLLNDATIAQVPTAHVTYWHVELDAHDILLAENLPAESFLDTGIRGFFANAGSFTQLHPDFSPLSLDDFCNPLVQAGPIVDAVRTRLLARARTLGWTLTGEDDLHIVADGAVIRPERAGDVARFALPAGCRAVELRSRSFVPERVQVGAGDGRRLGVPLRGVSLTDGHGIVRRLPIDSDLLAEGVSFVQASEAGAWRWTTGAAVLPAALWAGCAGTVTLAIETASDEGTLQAWLAPAAPAAEQGVEQGVEADDRDRVTLAA